MGFFSNLFKTTKGNVVIKFYEENEVSVSYNPTQNKVQKIALDFLGYNQAICNYLGEDFSSIEGVCKELSRESVSPAMLLRKVLRKEFETSIDKNQNVLNGEIDDITYSLKKVEPKKEYFIIYEGKFYARQSPKLKIPSQKNKSYYGPMSVLAFLQHIIDILPQKKLNRFHRKAGEALTPSI